jgi:hypothetical protein
MQSYKKNNCGSHTDPVTITFSQKENSVYFKFDIFLAKQKCQIRPVAYHYFSVFRKGEDPFLWMISLGGTLLLFDQLDQCVIFINKNIILMNKQAILEYNLECSDCPKA